MALKNPAFDIIPENFAYTVEQFKAHVDAVAKSSKYMRPVAFALVAEVWALHTNNWIEPRLTEAEFYSIVRKVVLWLPTTD